MSHTPHELAAKFPDQHDRLHDLKVSNAHFNKLSDEYHSINRQIHRYDAGVESTSDFHLEDLKKKRLKLIDQISTIVNSRT